MEWSATKTWHETSNQESNDLSAIARGVGFVGVIAALLWRTPKVARTRIKPRGITVRHRTSRR
ncbi:hypothetical protein PT2222_110270 [Paraburkholderia tropica]